MDVYLASPRTQQQAQSVCDMNVLLSFGCYSKWLDQYQAGFEKVLIDSGAYSELNSGKKIDVGAYKDWSAMWIGRAEAIAGLDDISGDWKRSMKNYEFVPWSFPTWHDTDPIELLPELAAMAKERKTWLGIGLKPPREKKERLIREALEMIPESTHVHGWALRAYQHIKGLDSVDSTNWWRDAMGLRKTLPWLNFGECLEIIVKRYKRETRIIREPERNLFECTE